MKTFTTILLPLLFAATSTGVAQIRADLNTLPESDETTVVRLTADMFFPQDQPLCQSFIPQQITDKAKLTDSRINQSVFFLGSEVLRSSFNMGFFAPAPYPLTVTEYNHAVRRQMFDAEPTSQQRRTRPLFRFQ